jgi:hypothetical protein
MYPPTPKSEQKASADGCRKETIKQSREVHNGTRRPSRADATRAEPGGCGEAGLRPLRGSASLREACRFQGFERTETVTARRRPGARRPAPATAGRVEEGRQRFPSGDEKRFIADLVAAGLPPARTDPVDEWLQAAPALSIEIFLERPLAPSAIAKGSAV